MAYVLVAVELLEEWLDAPPLARIVGAETEEEGRTLRILVDHPDWREDAQFDVTMHKPQPRSEWRLVLDTGAPPPPAPPGQSDPLLAGSTDTRTEPPT